MIDPSRYTEPPFRITRMSHVCVTAADLEKSCTFYQDLAGMKVSHRDDDAAYLRGVEETCHHSLVLRKSSEAASCDAIGFRVLTERDLDAAAAYFADRGESTEWIERPGQGRTLFVRLSSGSLIEFVVGMELMPRALTDYQAPRGGRVHRLDHVQVVIPDVAGLGDALMDMGFRAAELIRDEESRTVGLFLHRKNNPHDIVLSMGAGPRLHHFAYVVADLQAMFRACDVAGNMGIGQEVERGPGRHGPGNGAFVYFRDPDGHRLEMILAPMQFMDPEEATRIWTSQEKHQIVPWGLPAPQRWREEATRFTDVPLSADGELARWVSR